MFDPFRDFTNPLVSFSEKEKEKIKQCLVLRDVPKNHVLANPGQPKLIDGEKFSGLLSGAILKMTRDDTLSNFQNMNKALKARME